MPGPGRHSLGASSLTTRRGAPRAGRKRALIGVVDQMLYSLTNFALTVLIAHQATAGEFGAYSVLLATYLVSSAVNRGISSEPLIVRFSAASADESRRAARAAATRAVSLGVVTGLVLIAIGFGVVGRFADLYLVFGCAVPGLFFQDFLRYAALTLGRPALALANDATVAVVQAALTLCLFVVGRPTPVWLVASWVAAGLCGALVAALSLRVSPNADVVKTVRTSPRLSRQFGLDNFVTQLTQQGAGYLVAAFVGLAAAGGLRAAQTVFTPPATLMLGMQLAVTPELVRLKATSLRRMRAALLQVTTGLLAVSVVYYVLVLLIPARAGSHLFGASWSSAHGLLPLVGVGSIAGGQINAAVSGLRALADGNRTLRARYAGSVVALGITIPATIIGGVQGAAVAIAVGTPLQAMLWWFHVRRSLTEHADVAAPS